ncbi:unnamed protein product [Acanthoscelides obtectus]|uniref:Uncharacterized protein n=1 Tax=Acanthoscelides obtectus TaxID=200917 RepID=A0A9P0KXD1_ACAOB|nr:unnamed protein product [Acanthoscelides obtectus]CAK1681903.1 hypothetical protein AOBTE_LOCUS33324 [Acanthoscelides obtectus]
MLLNFTTSHNLFLISGGFSPKIRGSLFEWGRFWGYFFIGEVLCKILFYYKIAYLKN